MTLGGYTLDAIDAGRLRLDGGAMFGIVPKNLWARQTPADDENRITLAMRCLLLRGHGRTVLVDCGLGDRFDDRFAKIYGVEHPRDTLARSLEVAGVGMSDVTDVLLTHLHFDHAGGATVRGEDGALAPAFPNATYHVQRGHWAWAHESPRETASFLPEHMAPLEAAGCLNLLGPGETPLPNVELVTVDGHTRGMQLPLLRDPEGGAPPLLYAADLFPTAAHVPLLWIMAYDVAPLDTLAEKGRLLARASEEEWTVMFEHDPTCALARIARTDRGFEAADRRDTL
ncbi:MAG TPA: MBL fold metallo-hydrolase [Rhodothermales bacterium]|nr:MBL fold metallo-hydrolase [Rhodothermales bacterium]